MFRRLFLALVCVGVAVGLYFAFRTSGPGEEPDPIKEQPVDTLRPAYYGTEQGLQSCRDAAAALMTPGAGFPAAVPWYNLSRAAASDNTRHELVGTLALAPAQGFPAALPWHALVEIGGRGGYPLENLLATDPLAFLEMCLDRYEREVRGYQLTFIKKERIGGKLYPPEKDKYEVVKVAYREKPFSVHFTWVEGQKLAAKVLYVEGQNDGKMLARPRLTFLPIMTRDVDSADAKSSGRYTIDQFGLYLATKRGVDSMRDARARGKLHIRYEGLVKVDQLGGRPCYKFVRAPYEPLEEDALYELTVYIDQETWLQVASVLRDPQGHLLAEYYFRDVELNPEFPATQFTRDGL